jgi:hypothetical protein
MIFQCSCKNGIPRSIADQPQAVNEQGWGSPGKRMLFAGKHAKENKKNYDTAVFI